MSINAYVSMHSARLMRSDGGGGWTFADDWFVGRAEHLDWLATGACCLFASLGPLLFGYDIGVSYGGAIESVAKDLVNSSSTEDPDWVVSSWELGVLPTISMFGALLASLIIMLSGNTLGRRAELLLAAVVYGISSVLVNLDVSLAQLLALRCAIGLANGLSIHASAAFIAETCPSCVRGSLICLKEAMLVGGILKGYLVAGMYVDAQGGWRMMYTAAAPVAAAMWLGVWFLPDSPRWLLLADYKCAVAQGRQPGGGSRQATPPSGSSPSAVRALQRSAHAGGPLSRPLLAHGDREVPDLDPLGDAQDPPQLTVIEHGAYGEGGRPHTGGHTLPPAVMGMAGQRDEPGGGAAHSAGGARVEGVSLPEPAISPWQARGGGVFALSERQRLAHMMREMLAEQLRHGFWPQRRQLGSSTDAATAAARAAVGAPPSGLARISAGGSSASSSASASDASYSGSATADIDSDAPERARAGGQGNNGGPEPAEPRSAGYVRARAALVRAWGSRARRLPRAVDDEMAAIALSAREATLSGVAPLRQLTHALYYRPLAVGLLLMLFQQVTGQPAVMAGSRAILSAAGVTTRPDEAVTCFRLLVTFVTAVAVDVVGRRPMLLVGASGMAVGLLALGACNLALVQALATAEQLAWASVLSMGLALACFQLSWGPISWLYCGEIFPLGIRGPAIAASNACGFSSSIAVTLLLPRVQAALGSGGTYAACAVVSLAAVMVTHMLVPETKGKSLEEIEMYWGGDRMPSFETSSFSDWLP